MSYLRSMLIAWTIVLLGPLSLVFAEESQILPRAGVLVLHSGRVLHGNIVRVGDRYVVALSDTDEVGVPVDRVEMHCASLTDAYQRKKGALPASPKVSDHLQLADWCLRYELMASAAEQLMAAQSLDPRDPANQQFEKRLRLAASRSTTSKGSTPPPTPVISQTKLDQMVRELPAGVVEQFTTTIQPMLINHCGASSCHGPNSASDFRLVFPSGGRPLPRRFTQRNLHSALELLDRTQPAHSPLLAKSTEAHGGAPKPSLSEADVVQQRRLAEWAYRSLSNQKSAPPAELITPASLLLQPLDPTTATPARAGEFSAKQLDDRAIRPTESTLSDPAVQPVAHTQPVGEARQPTRYQAVDPFDPEVFNRRFRK